MTVIVSRLPPPQFVPRLKIEFPNAALRLPDFRPSGARTSLPSSKVRETMIGRELVFETASAIISVL